MPRRQSTVQFISNRPDIVRKLLRFQLVQVQFVCGLIRKVLAAFYHHDLKLNVIGAIR
jgi:hypothetical protein